LDEFAFREVSRANRADFATLFESRGGPKSCWCMVWRATPAEAKRTDGKSRRAAMQARIDDRVPVGILAYHQDAPVAWCSIAPRDTYRPLGGLDEDAGQQIWSLVCFFIKRQFRGRGLMHKLIGAAIEHAARGGATVVEAYPVDANSPSYRFMGFVDVFHESGFKEVGTAGRRRHVMQLTISNRSGGHSKS
jgi:RimJ/RimL family protein N-acetyltransferase